MTAQTNGMVSPSEFRRRFQEIFPDGGEPTVCRAPGRVNLIGEHTDYNGLPVFPETIRQDIRIAFAPHKTDRIRMHNVDTAFPHEEFSNCDAIEPSPLGSWHNYCKAAVERLNHYFGVAEFTGMDMLVSGDIPISAGLSSSSALVVASALAYLHCLGKELDKDVSRIDLAAILAEAEHYVGTKGGGMDQAIILLGDEYAACKINFFPLRVEYVPLPRDHATVVCNSLVKAEKTGEALHRYNAGPLLCRLICAMVANQICQDYGEHIEIQRLGDLWFGDLCLTHAEVEDVFRRTFPNETTCLEEAAAALGISPEEIRDRWLGELKEPEEGFPLKARARHQLTEFQRVEAARDCLLAGDAAGMGALMNASHESCATDFGISCPELDMLVTVAREAGAVGARLTGAGFGGCSVNLVPVDGLEDFFAALQKRYYEEYLGGRRRPAVAEPIFVAHASPGAGYI